MAGGEGELRLTVVESAPPVRAEGDAVFLAVEVKRPGKKPDAGQVAFLEAINRAGGVGVAVWGVDDMVDVLGRIDSGELP